MDDLEEESGPLKRSRLDRDRNCSVDSVHSFAQSMEIDVALTTALALSSDSSSSHNVHTNTSHIIHIYNASDTPMHFSMSVVHEPNSSLSERHALDLTPSRLGIG